MESYYKDPVRSLLIEDKFKLCQCNDCKTSGQEIYSLTDDHFMFSNSNSRQTSKNLSSSSSMSAFKAVTKSPPTPPKAAPRKAVSFRSNVEQIGSPNFKPLNDQKGNFQATPTFLDQIMTMNKSIDSCDSLHATKDFSQLLADNDMQPLDSSTPKMAAEEKVGSSKRADSGDQLIQVEVHREPPREDQPATGKVSDGGVSNSNYTCLCSPDFDCVHNNSSKPKFERAPNQINSINNSEFYKQLQLRKPVPQVDFPLSTDCDQCQNLSTYVNLSQTMTSQQQQQQSYYSNSSQQDYRSLSNRIANEANNVLYGNLAQPAQFVARPSAAEEQMHYMSAARHLLTSELADCELCRQQLRLNSSKQACCCNTLDHQNNSSLLNDSSKSYHTATSSSMLHHPNNMLSPIAPVSMAAEASQSTVIRNASELSVLPVGVLSSSSAAAANISTSNELGAKMSDAKQQTGAFIDSSGAKASNIDSSLSSLFVYRHVSDDNEIVEQPKPRQTQLLQQQQQHLKQHFDPDSLEISGNIGGAGSSRTINKSTSSNAGAPSSTSKQANSGSWLKTRPKSDYITLSSTTSSSLQSSNQSAAAAQLKHNAANNSRTVNSSSKQANNSRLHSSSSTQAKGLMMQDPTQSSLARRRQLSNSLNQQQQVSQATTATSNKKKLLASKLNSKSAPNISSTASRQHASNVKTIYQCFKNHLLDITKSNSSSSSNSTAKTPPSLSHSKSATLPKSLQQPSSGKSRPSSKAVQVRTLILVNNSRIN